MAMLDPESKRPRLTSWNPPSHPPDAAPPYPHVILPLPAPVAPAPYPEHEAREPAAAAAAYGPGSAYGTPMEAMPASAYARPAAGTPIKMGSPGDGPPPAALRSLSLSAVPDAAHALHPSAVDHHPAPAGYDAAAPPPLEVQVSLPLMNHDGHAASFAPSPLSAGPRDPYFLAGGMLTSFPRRKAIRAAQACDACRQRKAKCDEGRPSCGFCREALMPCVYREVPPPKQDRTLLQILHKLEKLDQLDHLQLEIHDLRAMIKGGELVPADRAPAPAPSPGLDLRRASMPTVAHAKSAWPDPVAGRASHSEPDHGYRAAKAGGVEPQGELSIPLDHTTAAHKLLRWPSIRKLVDPVTQNEHYVMQGEERRGLLRVWGRGEGGDAHHGGPLSVVTAPGTLQSEDPWGAPDWSRAHVSAHHRESWWGHGPPRAGGVLEMRRPATDNWGGLNPDGSLKLDRATLERLLHSYLEHMQIMHPILDPDRIAPMVHAVSDRYGGGAARPSVGAPGAKRKRSSANLAPNHAAPDPPAAGPGPPEHSIGTALVLLVAALGKVCEHTDYLPGPAPDPTADADRSASTIGSSPTFRTDSPPMSVKHSPASSHSSSRTAATSPRDPTRMPFPAGRAPVEAPSPVDRSAPINADVVPGLAYYAYATAILGELHGGNELIHVQAGLLAGLYAGQLGRVLESWKWINWACTGCQVLIRRYSSTAPAHAAPSYPNAVAVNFWTCLQLESDILAELDLPPSGISRLEEVMPFPMTQTSLMWSYYSAQIYLRKLLNRVHLTLYKPGQNSTTASWSMGELAELNDQLKRWRDILPPELGWADGDPPPSDINAARLRAKYYGARYIIYRPFLHYAIHLHDPPEAGPTRPVDPHADASIEAGSGSAPHRSPTRPTAAPDPAAAAGGDGSMPPPVTPASSASSAATHYPLDAFVRDACRSCIQAAMQSTAAFHGMEHRPMVTNIFGTAHAQFGNLLVLQATARHPVLRDYVPREQLHHLLHKTVAFLRHLGPISPTLKFDAEILERSMRPAPLLPPPPVP
ncbi:MAG: hypothetical protein M1826_001645, partial [Phylliscum demangeonii]